MGDVPRFVLSECPAALGRLDALGTSVIGDGRKTVLEESEDIVQAPRHGLLDHVDVDCIIGERPDERTRTQRLRVDVVLTIGDRASETDELSDTVDYAALTESIRAALIVAKCKMIERAAKVVCDLCLADAKVSEANVRVTKSGAIEHLESAAAVIEAAK